MRRKNIGDTTIAQMKKDGVFTLIYGDGQLTDIGYDADKKSCPPLEMMSRVLTALGRDDRFVLEKYHGMDARGRPRLVRGVRLKEEHR